MILTTRDLGLVADVGPRDADEPCRHCGGSGFEPSPIAPGYVYRYEPNGAPSDPACRDCDGSGVPVNRPRCGSCNRPAGYGSDDGCPECVVGEVMLS